MNGRCVLLDADVIFHFMTNNRLGDLHKILAPCKCLVLDHVYHEVSLKPLGKAFIDAEITCGNFIKISLPINNDISKAYAYLGKISVGNGERACMAYATFSKDIIASSNFADIAKYCSAKNIDYIGTLDILLIACKKNFYTEPDCDVFIENTIVQNKAKYPKGVNKIRFYIHNNTLVDNWPV